MPDCEPKAVKEQPIPASMSVLAGTVKELGARLEVLYNRIAPVLQPQDGDVPNMPVGAESKCSLASDIDSINTAAVNLICHLNENIDRVEL